MLQFSSYDEWREYLYFVHIDGPICFIVANERITIDTSCHVPQCIPD